MLLSDQQKESVELDDVRCIAETDKAILCKINGKECWVPKSQVTDDSEVFQKDHQGTLIVTDWFAQKAGLI